MESDPTDVDFVLSQLDPNMPEFVPADMEPRVATSSLQDSGPRKAEESMPNLDTPSSQPLAFKPVSIDELQCDTELRHDEARSSTAANETDCAKKSCMDTARLPTWEATSHWELLDVFDYAQISQTCRRSLDIVWKNTPSLSKHPLLARSSLAVGSSCLVVVSWEGDVLCMDNVVDYFSRFGECIPEDWSGLHGLNVVQLRFDSADSAASACHLALHAVANARGRKISVTAELAMSEV